jgi:nitroreductase
MRKYLLVLIFLTFASTALCQEQKKVVLPKPRMQGGMPLMQALKERKTQRDFSPKELEPQVLSDLLWAADGVSRPDGHRTAPSANNVQEIDVYVAKADGLYLYNAAEHALEPVLKEDIRPVTGIQSFVSVAPVNLVYVADLNRAGKNSDKREFYAAADTSFISENVYLFCASQGLATVVRGWYDEEKLSKTMKLREGQKIILTQTVGYPK